MPAQGQGKPGADEARQGSPAGLAGPKDLAHGAGREAGGATAVVSVAGDCQRFLDAYPKKSAQAAARRLWASLGPELPGLDTLLAALARHCASPAWAEAGGRFIPTAANWLERRSWTGMATGTATGTGAASATGEAFVGGEAFANGEAPMNSEADRKRERKPVDCAFCRGRGVVHLRPSEAAPGRGVSVWRCKACGQNGNQAIAAIGPEELLGHGLVLDI